MNLFKSVKISDFRILSGWIEKYKPALSKSDSSWDNSYCVRLVIVSLAVNIGKLQSLVSEDNFFIKRITMQQRLDLFNWTSFHNDIETLNPIDKVVIKKYLDYKFSIHQNQLKVKSDVLPYVDNLSHRIKNKFSKLCKEFCKENFNIKLVFNSSLMI